MPLKIPGSGLKMDLKKLSWFFEDEVRDAHTQFLARVPAGGIGFLDALGDNLSRRLFEQTHRMLVAQYKFIEEHVSFDDFCSSLRQPDIRTYLHQRYPVLRQWMTGTCQDWLEQSCLLTTRFLDDYARLQSGIFADSAPLEVARVEPGLGDLHRGGKSVAMLRLRDGRKFLYKPRSMAIDTHFQVLVRWLGERGNADFCTPVHLDRGDYGWVQFIEQKDCESAAQVERFYHRLGGLLAALHFIEGTDFHYENIIAAGEYPILIDLESLFQPPVPVMAGAANGAMDSSVLRVGILPNRTAGASGLPETAGVSNAEGQPGLNRLHLMRDEDGQPSLVRGRAGLLPAKNVPTLQGSRVQIDAGQVLQLQRGFEQVYRTVLAHRTEFLSLIDQFSGDQIRVLFRHTATYAHLRDEARHPSSMTSLEAVADRFELLRLVVPEYRIAERFVQFEIEDLARGDIPLFTTRVASRHLWYSDDACLENFFDESGRDAAARKVGLLSEQDLARQLWIIRNSFGLHEGRRGLMAIRGTQVQPSTGSEPADRMIAAAASIADQMVARFHVDGDCASWLVHTPTSLDNRQFDLAPASYDLYCGMPGEILFFSQLSAVTGRFEYRELAHKALNFLQLRLLESKGSICALGLYAGWGSVVHLMTELAKLESDYLHLQWLEELLVDSSFDRLIAADASHGLVKGSAGFMLACADLYLSNGSRRALQLAEAVADHLLSQRCEQWPGYSWRISSGMPLSGLAHGASGFAMAFGRLFEATGDARYGHASVQCVEYESHLFVPEQGNWRDCRDIVIREHGDRPFCSVAWSHGAPGIGLARLAMMRAGMDSVDIRRDLDVAVQTTLRRGFSAGDSLTYGAFGSLELLLSYSECLGDELLPEIAALTSSMLDRVQAGQLRLGAPVAMPLGLMTGVTGVAYQCLRAARMRHVPSVLCGVSRI